MDDIYLIEIRLSRTKWRIRETIEYIGQQFLLEPYLERHPHVTLFGPLTLNEGVSSRQLLDIVGHVASTYDPILFTLDGWELREGMHGSVIAIPVRPSDSLKKITSSLFEELSPFVHSQNAWDSQPASKWFHVTAANHLDPQKAQSVFSLLADVGKEEKEHNSTSFAIFSFLRDLVHRFLTAGKGHAVHPVTIDETGLRITVMQGEAILAEYDLLKKQWITADHRHTNKSWQTTLTLFRQQVGFERKDPQSPDPLDIFLIADLHLGHANIIRYCSRPFLVSDAGEMDHVLIKNWNYTISSRNRVYHLGDLRYGIDALSTHHYRNKLKGRIIFIQGNHDEPELGAVPSAMLKHRGFTFLLVHDPVSAPKEFDGWIIHGHHHNNDLLHYPFIDFEHRRINVCAEVIGYVPQSLNSLCTILQDHISRGDTAPILLNYPHVPR
ncbi:MAG: 2'-5' RNA ligase family protein [Methanoregula sp.]|nr:2'-5' RNA ligase family protein [Methanoregula sp.]